MIRSAAATILLVALMLALRYLYEEVLDMTRLPTAASLGFVLVASYTFARLFVPLKIPKLCAYIIMGMICGPYALNLISKEGLADLRLIEKGAIALIAITAGGEIKWKILRERYNQFLIVTGVLVAVLFLGTVAGFFAAAPLVGGVSAAGGKVVLASAILIGVSAVAKSPATAVAVIKETRSKGLLTETVLTVVLLLDVAAVILFAFAMSLSEQMTQSGGAFDVANLFTLLWHIAGALPVGFVVGVLSALYLRYARGHYLLFVFLLCLLLVEISNLWGMELIMMAVVVGFTVENLSGQGDEMLRAIDRSDLPIYVAFFTLAGASINLTFLGSNLGVTALFVFLIGLLTWLASESGGWLAGLKTPHRHYLFTGLIAPAGLNLSFASIVRDRLNIDLGNGLTLGESLQTLIVALVAVKQLVGPILFRFALERVGEVHGGEKEETTDKAPQPEAAAGET